MNWHDSIGFQTSVMQKAFPKREARSVSFPIQRTRVTRVTRDVFLCLSTSVKSVRLNVHLRAESSLNERKEAFIPVFPLHFFFFCSFFMFVNT